MSGIAEEQTSYGHPQQLPFNQMRPVSPVELQEVRKTKRTRTRADSKTNPIKDRKKRRLEQNRISARESRKKKKRYITDLEAKVEMLKRKLREMEERNVHEAAWDEFRPDYCTCGMRELRKKIDIMVNMVIIAANKQNTLLVSSELEKLKRQCIEEPNEIEKIAEGLINSLVQCIIPKSFARLLWMAKNNKDLFSARFFESEEFKDEPFANEVTLALDLEEEESKVVKDVEDILKRHAKNFSEHYAELRDASKKILNEVQSMSKSLDEGLVEKLGQGVAVRYLEWVAHNPAKTHFYSELAEDYEGGPLLAGDGALYDDFSHVPQGLPRPLCFSESI